MSTDSHFHDLPVSASPNAHLETTCDYASEAQASELVRILDSYLARLKAGQAPSKADLIAQHPELASQLEACLAGLEFIHSAESASRAHPQTLGDFRILREVGRGGMGAVFEAEQISLGRRVALKILRFGGVSDPEAIERFQREAETVAKLHHTNIVPIFAVGSERGVNYYAMQFIDGRSLAEVLADKQGPLPPGQVADWGLQAAEALAHAHQRGVIHRDVKPSNLLLDKERRLWLTDFGLARRLDDVTLSMTGALLGTPRYMSPEQAIASKKRIDHRSDLFSLGATLYELVTGQPAFAGETPHDVIQQILTGEPTPIRQLRSPVPRDLETIVMKCLAKEPGQRYSAARNLADDLRAFLDGRPIRARRASLVETAARWLKQQQRSVKLAATAAALTLGVTIAAIFGWSGYDAWRQASIKLAASRPPLVAEILNSRDEVLRVETAPMQNPASLAAGNYRLRVSGNETLSQTFDVELDRGSEAAHTLDLADQMLLAPREIEGGFDVVDFGIEQGLVLWNEKGMGLKKRFGPLGWSRELDRAQLPNPASAAGFRWPWHPPGDSYSGYGPWDMRPWVAPKAVDVDGTGALDLIVAGRHQAWLMAIDGDQAKILWFAPRGHDLSIPAPQSGNFYGSSIKSGIVGTPIFGHDVNADGAPDVIAALIDIGEKPELSGERYRARCWVEAICSKTGRSLWSYDIPPAWFDLRGDGKVPYDLRWFAGSGGGNSSGGRSTMRSGRNVIRESPFVARTGTHGYQPAAIELIQNGSRTELAVVAGQHFVSLNAGNGGVVGQPADIGARPGRTCQWGDVDGDGYSDLMMLEELGPAAFPLPPKARLVVWSPGKRRILWSKKLDVEWPIQPGWAIDAPKWPLVGDLNRDGKCEIVVPSGRYNRGMAGGRLGSSEIPWGLLTTFSGDTGKPLWTRRLVSMDQQIDHFLAGPDLDGDGWQELYVATLEGGNDRVHVDALSGISGKTLWTASHAPPPTRNSSRSFHLLPPYWWQSGDDGWPQLVTLIKESDSSEPESLVCAFSAGTGQLLHVGHGISDLKPADIDRDGAEDLLVLDSKVGYSRDRGGRVHAVRGVAAEPWRKLGPVGEPAGDFDADGVVDLVQREGSRTLSAISGRKGFALWREQPVTASEFQFRPARPPKSRDGLHRQVPSGDLNGDGTEDLLIWSRDGMQWQRGAVFHAVSGRTGKRLWTAGEVTIQILSKVLAAEAHDLDGDGRLEVLWLAALDYGYPLRESISSHEAQLWLFATSGQTGKLKWSHPLSPAYGATPGQTMLVLMHETALPIVVGDVSGDGISDVFVPAAPSSGRDLETRVVSGKDGTTIWARAFPTDPNRQFSAGDWIPPAVCDLDGDGKVEVAVVELQLQDGSGNLVRPSASVVAVDGRTGQKRWEWASPTPLEYWYSPTGTGKGTIMRPHILRAEQQQRIAVLLPGNEGQMLMFDAAGNVQTRKADHQTSSSGLWVCDADGDGTDELVAASGQSVQLLRADQPGREIWSRSFHTIGQRILDVLPRKGAPPLIAVALDATDNSVTGIDASTGRLVWTCGGPILRDVQGVFLAPQHVRLLNAGEQAPPHVFYAYGSVARSRQATLSEEAVAAKVPLVASRVPPNLAGIKTDSRWERSLPWINHHTQLSAAAAFIGWAMFFGLTLYVIPGGYVLWLIALRRFGLRMLLGLPVIVALVITAALFQSPHMDGEFQQLLGRLTMGAIFAAPVVGMGVLLGWSIKRRWRPVMVWLVITVIVSLLAAGVFLWKARSMSPMIDEEHYDWDGWYLIWFLGAFFTSQIMMVVLPVKYLVFAGWKRWRGKSAGAAAPQPDGTVAAATPAASKA